MKVTLIQMDIKWGDIAANCGVASQLIDSAPGSDLYVLPEMFSTGFAIQPEDVADADGTTLQWMQQKADETKAAIAGSVAVQTGDSFYNRFYFVKPTEELEEEGEAPAGDTVDLVGGGDMTASEGTVTYYDKHHLFTYGGEHRRYTAGQERVVVQWRGVRFLLQVCYDLRFPVYARNTVEKLDDCSFQAAYDCALYVASWPTSRIAVWHALLKARAIENQCYIAGVDRVGDDPVCQYCGGTECYDAYGRLLDACQDNTSTSITFEIDVDKLNAFRRKFPVLMDGDVLPNPNHISEMLEEVDV